tara:strand:+ start:772 stop:1317 length:546 start_codon:yes stop_codon:yes gene_type:complete
MNYAKYEKLPIKLNSKNTNNCIYKERKNNTIHSNKCANTNSTLVNDYLLDDTNVDDCKLIYNNRIINNVVSNKNNKQLSTRIVKTIPYRNYTEFTYNPELEVLINAGMQTSTRKSVGNTSEVLNDGTPMQDYIKNKIKDKNNSFDLSRFQLSSRQIKGNKVYIKKYKKNIKKIQNSLIQEE